MSYNIIKTNGSSLGTVLDGTINTTATSLTLIGRNYANYGQLVLDNFVALLENSAYSIEPSNPIAGQLWWNTDDKRLRVYTGSNFKIISSATAQSTAPSTTVAGDIWWDTSNSQLYVYNGTTPYSADGWILVGPQRNNSGAVWEQISDGTTLHNVLSIKLEGKRTSIINLDADFAPNPSILGFSTIGQGLTANTSINSGTFYATANNANYLGLQPASNYLRSDISDSTDGALTIANNTGLTVGLTGNLQITTTTGGDVSVKNTKSNGDINFYANVSGTNTLAFGIDGATGTAALLSATLSGSLTLAAGATVTGALNVVGTGSYSGNLTAPTQGVGVADTTVATTEWVVNNSGFLKNKIYQGNSYLEILDTGTGSANLVVDGTSVATASASGFNLVNGATATTQTQTYNASGNARVATTQFVKTATTWWGGSAKFVSTDAPELGVNDAGSNNGDFWFQREA
jgi:hypothetical protein